MRWIEVVGIGDCETYQTRQKENQVDRSWSSESPPLADNLHQTIDLAKDAFVGEQRRTNGSFGHIQTRTGSER